MFAVPGWSLPSAPVTQKEVEGGIAAKRSKKRKRKHSDDVVGDREPATINIKEGDRGNDNIESRDGRGEKRRNKEHKSQLKHQAHVAERAEEDGAPVGKKSKSETDADARPHTEHNNPMESEKDRKLAVSKLAQINHKLSKLVGSEDPKSHQDKKSKLEKQREHWNKVLYELDSSSTPSSSLKTRDIASTKSVSESSKPTDRKPQQSSPPSHSGARSTTTSTPTPHLTPLQASMRAKLASARFRHLNEQLYTSTSSAVQKLFTADPQMFDDYHAGFRQQVASWPANPVESFVADVARRAAATAAAEGEDAVPLPRTKGVCTVADLGAGEGRLALGVRERGVGLGRDKASGKALNGNVRVVSYDLVGKADVVLAADIADLPLKDGCVDVAVFCLALMGTNWLDFVDEAWRVLRAKGGELWVAEIKSRFGRVERAKGKPVKHSVGAKRKAADPDNDDEEFLEPDDEEKQDQTDVSEFVEVFKNRGFVLDQRASPAVDLSNKMFVKMRFIKSGAPVRGKNAKSNTSLPLIEKGVVKKGGKWLDDRDGDEIDESKVLKPCVYKLR